jgi:hypothetical protein
MVDPEPRLAQLSRRKKAGAMIYFVMEACNGGLHRLLEQGLLTCKPLSILVADIVLAIF